ncbi:hypothetical protein [Fodinicola acaciae]|uniref:hypothetical protein n=1 Tax=Fodinicola acaciae TaxID=2681555 RepID=UPI0013D21DCA|nr:hypothetical protein [Fodinicola acaciae]
MSETKTERHVRQWTRHLMADLRECRTDAASALIAELVGPDGPNHWLLRPVLAELTRCTAALIEAAAPYPPNLVDCTLLINTADGRRVTIDDLDPPVRATMRAILALLHHNDADAELQLDLVADSTDAAGTADAILHAILWTQSAVTACEQSDLPVPAWLATEVA